MERNSHSAPIKIAFTGAHGVGKTTLLKLTSEGLREKGVLAEITDEIPRLICDAIEDQEFFRRENNSLARQNLIIQNQLVRNEIDTKRPNDFLLFDRTPIDHWAYTKVLFQEQLDREGVKGIQEKILAEYTKTFFDSIFYLPIEFPPVDDGTRESDNDFQKEIDRELTRLYRDFDISTETVTGSSDKRKDDVLEELEKWNLTK